MALSRTAIDTLLRMMDVAYRGDPFSALRRNLKGITPEEWDIKPASWSTDEFGDMPELSICDLVVHVGGAKYMYANRAFGDASLEWATVPLPAAWDMETVLSWLDEGHRQLADGLAGLTNDAQLDETRQAPWRTPIVRRDFITIMISHDLYHSGEINRQRALIRGAQGWDRAT